MIQFRSQRGFALVVSLALLVLLSVIGLGMLNLSAITLRSSMQDAAMMEARANARMALMIAIGELQKQMGPDQRISARAEILDTNPSTLEVDGVAHPHYLGVWDSWNTWLTDNRGGLSIQDTYQYGRHPSLFRKWLVSHPDADNYAMALNDNIPPSEMVTLIGPASAGPDTTNHVQAAMVNVRNPQGITGKYAWWITDESIKARLDLEARQQPTNASNAAVIASHTGRMGVEKMEGMAGFDITPASLRKTISIRQAGISAARANEHFHDLTAHSLGLHTDVRFGGFKNDLNLAFESDLLPGQMQETSLFGRSFDAPIRPMTGAVAGITPQNPYIGPISWRQLREFYRIYRSGFADSGMKQPLAWESGQPVTNRLLIGKEDLNLYQWDTMGYTRQPVMLRQTWIIATSSLAAPTLPGGIDYYLLAIPVITLWNPYNVTLKMESNEVSFGGAIYSAMNLQQLVYRDGVLVSQTDLPDETRRPTYYGNNSNPNQEITANQLGFRMTISNAGSGQVVFKPGEVRIFSTNDQITNTAGVTGTNNRFFTATPGYNPIQSTTAGVLRGLRYRIYPGEGAEEPELALGFIRNPFRDTILPLPDMRAPPGSSISLLAGPRSAPIIWSFQEGPANDGKTIFEDGSNVDAAYFSSRPDNESRYWTTAWTGFTALNWIDQGDVETLGWLIPNSPATRARWPNPGEPPLPVGMVSILAKSPQRLPYEVDAPFTQDFRNRGWLHAPATRMSNFILSPTDLARADSAYQLHFLPVNGDQDISQYLEADGQLGYFGGGYSASNGQNHVVALSVPTSPIMNLGSLAGMRMEHGKSRDNVPANGRPIWERYAKLKVTAHSGGAFGAGIGNSYAHPMISPAQVYSRNNMGTDNQATYFQRTGSWLGTGLNLSDDYWDHLFLANEELWDSWFCSGIAPVVHNGAVTQSKRDVALAFFNNDSHPLPPNHLPYRAGYQADELADLLDADVENTWEFIGAHILNKGQFNVNSTSKDAWKAVLMSLADRPLSLFDGNGSASVLDADADRVRLSRHTMAGSGSDATGPGDSNAWRGVRTLDEADIDKLAEEIVRQVKLRGPFLNMSEFINRRLIGDDDPLGVSGALQAAIDWDEFNAGYTGNTSGSGASINANYKSGDAMISTSQLPANYPNPAAATGSRYAGIPGYVMQSDILQGISSSLSVRGDTFLIRTYGESLNNDGTIAARAWCEAVLQRTPEYVNAQDEAGKKLRDPSNPSGNTLDLTSENLVYGRQFEIISFRWLNKDEI